MDINFSFNQGGCQKARRRDVTGDDFFKDALKEIKRFRVREEVDFIQKEGPELVMLVQFQDQPTGIIILVEGVRRQVKGIVLLERILPEQNLKTSTGKKLRIIVVTRPKEDFPPKDHAAMQRALDLLTDSGVSVVFKSNSDQKFAVMDQKMVWYGGINLLSYGSAQESIVRIDSANMANELMKIIEVT